MVEGGREEALPVQDGSIDLAKTDNLLEAVDRPYREGKAAAHSRRGLSADLDGTANRRGTPVFDPYRGPDRRLASADEWRGRLNGRRFHPRDQPGRRQYRHVTASKRSGRIGVGHLEAHGRYLILAANRRAEREERERCGGVQLCARASSASPAPGPGPGRGSPHRADHPHGDRLREGPGAEHPHPWRLPRRSSARGVAPEDLDRAG